MTLINPCLPSIHHLQDERCQGEPYDFPDGYHIDSLAQSVEHVSILKSAQGCDSLVVTHLTVHMPARTELTAHRCSGESYTFPDGSTWAQVTADSVHYTHLQTIHGCDSLVVTYLRVHQPVVQNIQATACYGDAYTFPDGSVWAQAVADTTHHSHLQTLYGCDSLVTTALQVVKLDTAVWVKDDMLHAPQGAERYQWVLLGDAGEQTLEGATAAQYMPTRMGRFAVYSYLKGCQARSADIDFVVTGLEDNLGGMTRIYPNPTTGDCTLDLGGMHTEVLVQVYDLTGRLVRSLRKHQVQTLQVTLPRQTGIYYLRIQLEGGSWQVLKILKQ